MASKTLAVNEYALAEVRLVRADNSTFDPGGSIPIVYTLADTTLVLVAAATGPGTPALLWGRRAGVTTLTGTFHGSGYTRVATLPVTITP